MSCLLALGLMACNGVASAQSWYREEPMPRDLRESRWDERAPWVYDDEARVIRVDPVFVSGYGSGERCYESVTSGDYAGDPRYDRYGRGDDYGSDDYGGGYGRPVGSQGGRTLATIAGGVVGAVLGSKVGGGSGQVAAAAIGSMVGGIAGREIYEQSQQRRASRGGIVRVCDPVPVRGGYGGGRDGSVRAYDVTYEYNGHRYTRRMDYNPGDRVRVRVRVDIAPD
jgi:hypothetical protein